MTPPRLYKYMPFSAQSLENIKNQVIYFGSPLQFNDPYDCALFPRVKEPTDDDIELFRLHRIANAQKESLRNAVRMLSNARLRDILLKQGQEVLNRETAKLLETKGVSCFAERPDNLLMWSHYADSHRGVCLEFRTDIDVFRKAKRVKYARQMPKVDLVKILCHEEEADDEILSLYCTKGGDWDYEREWRCIHNTGGTAYTYAADALTGVYFGAKASLTSFEIVALVLAGQNGHVQLWQGKRSESDFAIAFDKVTYTPHLEAKRRGLL